MKKFIVNYLFGLPFFSFEWRSKLYRSFGIKTRNCKFRERIYFGSLDTQFGENCYVNEGVYFTSNVKIGNHVGIGYDVLFMTEHHDYSCPLNRVGDLKVSAIHVKDGCWIGARAVILPGVTIHESCVIAAGAVVAQDCAPNGLYAGVPAKRIKNLPTEIK